MLLICIPSYIFKQYNCIIKEQLNAQIPHVFLWLLLKKNKISVLALWFDVVVTDVSPMSHHRNNGSISASK